MSSTHRQETYLGSQYLTYPTWQKGVVRTGKPGKELYCELAYDLVNNDVLCRFNGDPKISYLTPPSFVINGLEFTRQYDNLLGTDYQLYATVVHSGQTKLLKSLSNQLVLYGNSNGYEQDSEFNGVYQTTIKYHIRKGNARPQVVELTRKSVVRALHEQAKKIAARLPAEKLTIGDVANALMLYDSLMVATRVSKPIPDL